MKMAKRYDPKLLSRLYIQTRAARAQLAMFPENNKSSSNQVITQTESIQTIVMLVPKMRSTKRLGYLGLKKAQGLGITSCLHKLYALRKMLKPTEKQNLNIESTYYKQDQLYTAI